MKRRQTIISTILGGLATLFIVSVIGYFLIRSQKQPEKKLPPKVLRKVDSKLVNYASLEATVSATGRVVSQQSIDVIAEVQGKILKGDIDLKKGTDFHSGDVLVRIYNRDAAFSLRARKSAYLNALANILPDLKIDYEEAYPVWVDFFERLEIEGELEELPPIHSNQLKIFLSSRNVLSEYYAIKSDEVRLSKYTIRAPYNGAIQDVLLEVGSVANPGSRIARIIKTSQLEVEVPVESTSAVWLRRGDRAVLHTETDELTGKAIVKRISSFIDPETQSINVYLEVTEEAEPIYAGEYLRAEFSGMVVDNAMEIPRNAVFNRNQVFTVVNGFLQKEEINLLKINNKTIFFNGLPEGTEVVTQPLANANESMQVQTEFTQPPPSDSLNTDFQGEI